PPMSLLPASRTTEISPLSLHDALPISRSTGAAREPHGGRSQLVSAKTCRAGGAWRRATLRREFRILPGDTPMVAGGRQGRFRPGDRKSTRLNSSHEWISYAVFCLKKKK